MNTKSLFMLLLLMASSVQAQHVIKNPKIDYRPDAEVIKSITLTSKETRVDLYVKAWPTDVGVSISSELYLQDADSEQQYKLLRAEGFALDTKLEMPDSCRRHGTLYFEPLKRGVARIDLKQPNASYDKNWYGIHLTPQETPYPKAFEGTWYATDGSGAVKAIFDAQKFIYENRAWDYSHVQVSGKSLQANISCDGLGRTLYASLKRNGTLEVKIGKNGTPTILSNVPRYTPHPEAANWSYDPSRYLHEPIRKSGVSVIKGYIAHHRPEFGNNMVEVTLDNHLRFTQDKVARAPIEDDGSFSLSIPVAYSQYVAAFRPLSFLFLHPGDTTFIYFNSHYAEEGEIGKRVIPQFMGNGFQTEVNRFTFETKGILEDKKTINPYQDALATFGRIDEGAAAIQAYGEEQVEKLGKLIQNAPQLLSHLPLSHRLKDLFLTSEIGERLRVIYEEDSYYSDSEYRMKMDNGVQTRVRKEGFVPLDMKAYYTQLKPYYQLLFDNPLYISNYDIWVAFSRIENTALIKLARIEQSGLVAHFTKEAKDSIGTAYRGRLSVESQRLFDAHPFGEGSLTTTDPLLREMSDKVAALSAARLNAAKGERYWLERYYGEEIAKKRAEYGIENNFMMQIAMIRRAFGRMQYIKKSEAAEKLNELSVKIAAMLPYITHGPLRECLMAEYRTQVNLLEGEVKMGVNPEADKLFERLIAPYKGNVLFIDFWEKNCGPCITGMIAQRPVVEELKNHAIKFIYICNENVTSLEESNEFCTTFGIKGEHLRLTNKEWKLMSSKFNIGGIPHCVIIDKNGKVFENKADFDKEVLLRLEGE